MSDQNASATALAGLAHRERVRRWSATGAILLAVLVTVSAVSPPLRDRLEVLLTWLPFQVTHAAAATLVLVAAALVLTARGLRRGSRVAWLTAVGLGSASSALSLLKGLDWEEAVIAAAAVLVLLAEHRAFPVRPDARARRVALTLAVAVPPVAIVVAVAITQVSHAAHRQRTPAEIAEHVGVTTPWPLVDLGPSSVPILITAGIGLLAVVFGLLAAPRRPVPPTATDHLRDRERARAVVRAYGTGSLDYFALHDAKQWFFAGDGVVAYALVGGVCLVSPDPIAPPDQREGLWADFRVFAERAGWPVAVVGAHEEWLATYRSSGLQVTYLGDEAVVDSSTFTLQGPAMKPLRHAVSRVDRAGITVTFHDPATLDDDLRAGLLTISSMSRRGETERGFSMTLSRLFDPADTDLLLTVGRDPSGHPVGFIQWIPARDLPGWSLDVMRRDTSPGVPNGVIDTLIVRTLEHLAPSGGRLGLNFAVLRETLEGEPETPIGAAEQRLLRLIAPYSQMGTLSHFNAKYQPSWIRRYVVRGDGGQLVGQALAIARAEGLVTIPRAGGR